MNKQTDSAPGVGGPLCGITIIEVGGIGPVPFAGMMLADHGAHVIRIERPGASSPDSGAVRRSRTVVTHDLKTQEGQSAVRVLCYGADGLIEGFRPGTMERLGLASDRLLAGNPALVIGRMTGWGQTGPLAAQAGHDINYIALTGALHAIGAVGRKPTIPLNLIGDYAGGGLLLAFGMLAALIHARATGEGQVIDCAMTEGAALMMAPTYSRHGEGRWTDERGTNLLDGGAPFYDCYETADGLFVAIGSLETHFHRLLLQKIGLEKDALFDDPHDRARWPEQKRRLAAVFAVRTRDAWCALLEDADLCFAPVLGLMDAPDHPHNVARETFVRLDGLIQPAPAPRYSRTPLAAPRSPKYVIDNGRASVDEQDA